MVTTKLFSVVTTSSLLAFSCLTAVSAQVTPDGTTSTTVDVNGNDFTIDNGDRAGGNLFHSFGEFSVPTDGSAFFDNPLDIVNIFSRVTGGNISTIDGLLRANGTANLFLINPAGIIFGDGARLDIGGSFYGSTADSIIFSDGEFSALDTDNPPLLTINAPLGLGIRDNPADIATTLDTTGQSFANLSVNQGESINLVGGNINLDGASLNAPGGTIELGGLAVNGEVEINEDGSLSFPEELTKADVSLNNGTAVNVAADNGGSITVNANNLEVLGGSAILVGIVAGSQVAEAQAGDITINVTDTISLESNDPNNSSIIGNNVGDFSFLSTIGSAGNVTINTKTLEGNGNFQIGSAINGEGNAGNVNITATERVSLLGIEGGGSGIISAVAPSAIGNGADLTITTPTLVLSNIGLATSTVGQGNAGNIFINATDSISLSNASQIQAFSLDLGKAGDITIEAGSLSIEDASLINSSTFGQGNAGSLTIIAGSLSLENTGSIDSSTFGQGNAGNINLQVQGDMNLSESNITSQVQGTGNGDGGSITINATNISLLGGAQISSGVFGTGNAGNVIVTATEDITFSGISSLGFSSGVVNDLNGVGNAGDIEVKAQNLNLLDGGAITSSSFLGQGSSGNINIDVSGAVNISGFTVFNDNITRISQVATSSGVEGNAGNITITAGSLSLENTGFLNSSTFGQGNAGDISIQVQSEVSLSEANISSQVGNTGNGDGGNITVNATNISLLNGSQISSGIFGTGDAGNVIVTATEDITFSGINSLGFASGIINNLAGVGNAGDIEVKAQNLNLLDGGAITSSSFFGQGSSGNINIDVSEGVTISGFTVFDDNITRISQVATTSGVEGNAGNITITAGLLSLENTGSIDSSIFGQGNAGNINLQVQGDMNLSESNIASQVQGTGNGDGGSITINATNISLLGGSQISSGVFGTGNAGKVTVNATEDISFTGINSLLFTSFLS